MMKYTLIYALFLLVHGVQAQQPTQTQEATFKPTWYVGLQLTAQRYAVIYRYRGAINQSTPNTLSFIPAQLTAGYRLTDRLSLQTGLAYRHIKPYRESFNYVNPENGELWEDQETAQNSWAVPLQVRWRLSARPQRALRAELLAGLVYLGAHSTFSRGPVAGPLMPTTTTVQTVQGTAGLGLVRAFGPRLTGNFDLMLNRSFNQRDNAVHSQVQSSAISFYTANLGVRYNFR